MRLVQVVLILVVLSLGLLFVVAQQQPLPAPSTDRVGYPEGYKDWKVLFVLDRPDNKQVRVIYGNKWAELCKPGFCPYGSVLVMETYRAKVDDKTNVLLDANGRYQRGDLTGIFVQRKERGFGVDYKQLRNGDWEYVAYRPDKSFLTPPQNSASCAACHLQQGGKHLDFVFRAELFFGKANGAVPTATIKHYAFTPGDIRVKAGSTVTWYNDDQIFHDVKAASGSFGSGTMAHGSSFSQVFKEAGVYDYICGIHAGMRGKVIVEPAN